MKKTVKKDPSMAEVDPAFAPVVAALAKYRNVTAGKMMASYGLKVLSGRSNYFWLAFLVMLLPCSSSSQQQEGKEHLKTLDFFAGDWNCEGKFSSGKPIAAKLHFEAILGGAFMLFRHDDLPPHAYHAWAEWGWDPVRNQLIGVYEDSTGGVRIFRSNGWRDGLLQWFGGVLPDSTDQRFEFERMGEQKFRVSYSYKKNRSWTPVDSSVCTGSAH